MAESPGLNAGPRHGLVADLVPPQRLRHADQKQRTVARVERPCRPDNDIHLLIAQTDQRFEHDVFPPLRQ